MALFARYWLHLFLFFLPLAVYRLTSPKSIGFVDSGLLGAAAVGLGIPLPPGFPSYLLIAHLFTKIPIGTVAQRLYLLSNGAASISVVIVFLLARKLVKSNVAAVFSALSLGFSYQFWSDAINIETFALTNLSIVLILYLTITVREKFSPHRIAAIGFLLGLSLGLHPMIIVLVLAVFAWLVFSWKLVAENLHAFLLALVICMVTAIAMYSYIPLRASSHPFLNFSSPDTLSKTIRFITGGGELGTMERLGENIVSVRGFHWIPQILWDSFLFYMKMLLYQFHFLLLIMFFGFRRLFAINRQFFFIVLSIYVATTFLSIAFLSGNRESWMVTAWIALAVWMGVGVEAMLHKVKKRKYELYLRGGLLILSLLPLAFWYPLLDRSKHTFTSDYIENLYRSVPKNAVVIGSENFFEAQTAFARAGTLRSDIIPIAGNLLYDFPWYGRNISQSTDVKVSSDVYERIRMSKRSELSSVIKRLREGNPTRQFFVTHLFFRTFMQDAQSACREGLCRFENYALVPHGLLLEIVSTDQTQVFDFDLTFTNPSIYEQQPFYLEEMYKKQYNTLLYEYAIAYEAMGDYFYVRSELQKALAYYEKMISVGGSSNPEFTYRLAITYAKLSQPDKARPYFERTVQLAPQDVSIQKEYEEFLKRSSAK